MRHINNETLELICRFETFSPKLYICPAGYPTIGYGHLIKYHERKKFTGTITEAHARIILQEDVGIAERAVLRLISSPLSDGQFGALVSFTFNLGAGALQRSTLRRKVNRNAHEDAATEFTKWVWGGGRKLNGLVLRRKAESNLYLSP